MKDYKKPLDTGPIAWYTTAIHRPDIGSEHEISYISTNEAR